MKRGSWRAPRLTGIDVVVIICSLITQGVIRSWDYSTGDDQIASSLSLIEDAFPLVVWGAILGSLIITLTVGMWLRVHMLVWATHGLLGVVYFTLMVGMIIAVFSNNPFPWDGIRGGSILLTPCILHVLLAIRTGPKPLEQTDAVVDDTVVKDHA